MSQTTLTGAVYSPPRPGLPFIAVVFGLDGQTIESAALPSQAAGDAFLQAAFTAFAAQAGGTVSRG